jgi:hypothetical protein
MFGLAGNANLYVVDELVRAHGDRYVPAAHEAACRVGSERPGQGRADNRHVLDHVLCPIVFSGMGAARSRPSTGKRLGAVVELGRPAVDDLGDPPRARGETLRVTGDVTGIGVRREP